MFRNGRFFPVFHHGFDALHATLDYLFTTCLFRVEIHLTLTLTLTSLSFTVFLSLFFGFSCEVKFPCNNIIVCVKYTTSQPGWTPGAKGQTRKNIQCKFAAGLSFNSRPKKSDTKAAFLMGLWLKLNFSSNQLPHSIQIKI